MKKTFDTHGDLVLEAVGLLDFMLETHADIDEDFRDYIENLMEELEEMAEGWEGA